eukprot:Em0001g3353a
MRKFNRGSYHPVSKPIYAFGSHTLNSSDVVPSPTSTPQRIAPLLIEPSNRAILVVSSSKEMLPPLPSVDSVLVSSSAEESSCVDEQIYLFVSLRSKSNSNTGQSYNGR